MAKIVISYRRADSEAVTGRIRDRLVAHYGQDSVFMDIDSIPFGIDFRDYIKEALDSTDVLIAVMGTEWLGKNAAGSRIMEEVDPVRIEVETALARGIAVIPLLIDEAVMPQPAELPDSLKNLAFRNAAYVDSGRDFHLHMDRLIRSMDRLLGRVEENRAVAPAPAAVAAAPVGFAAMPPAEAPPQITMMAPPPRRRWGIWIAVGLGTPLALLGILAAIGLMMPNQQTGSQVAVAPPAPQPAAAPPPAAPAPAPVPAAPAPTPAPLPTPPVAQPATAPTGCNLGSTLVFQDSFNPPASLWEPPAADRKITDGQMVFTPEQGKFAIWLIPSLRFQDVTVCTIVRSPRQANELGGWAQSAIVFAATDRDNFYIAQILLDGTFRVDRRLGKEWISVVPRTKSAPINAGLDAVNEMRVVIKDAGKSGEFFVNGRQVTTFRVQPPEHGGAVGLFGGSEENRSTEWRFSTIAIANADAPSPRTPSANATAAATTPMSCKADRNTAFADDFKKPDPGWGRLPAGVSYQDGAMMLRAEAGRARPLLYLSLRYTAATACVNVTWPSGLVRDSEIMSAGIAFWAASYNDYYQASLYRNGTFDVARQYHGRWLIVYRRTRADSIRMAPDAVNQLKVHIVNNKGTLYINDVRVAEFVGQPPPRGGAVGLYAQADNDRPAEWRFRDIAVVE